MCLFTSVAQSCPTLFNPMDCSMPGLPVCHQLLEFTQTHVHWVWTMPSNHLILCCPLLLCLWSFPASGSFPMNWLFASGGQSSGASASASVLKMSVQGWFPLGLTGLTPCCPRDSQESSPVLQFKSINSSPFSLLYGPTLTSIYDYWKDHSFDYMDLCQQSYVFAF